MPTAAEIIGILYPKFQVFITVLYCSTLIWDTYRIDNTTWPLCILLFLFMWPIMFAYHGWIVLVYTSGFGYFFYRASKVL